MKRISISILAALVLIAAGALGGSLVGASAPGPPTNRVFSGLEYGVAGGNDLFTVPAGAEFVLTDTWGEGLVTYYRRDVSGTEVRIANTNEKTVWRGGVVMKEGETLKGVTTAGWVVGWSGYFQ